ITADESNIVGLPLAGWFGGVHARRNAAIQSSIAVRVLLRIVVANLDLITRAQTDPAVASGGHSVFKMQFKVPKFPVADDVGAATGSAQDSVMRRPFKFAIRLEWPPAGQIFAIEQLDGFAILPASVVFVLDFWRTNAGPPDGGLIGTLVFESPFQLFA